MVFPLPVEVHELEEVGAPLHGHGSAEQKEHDAEARGELPPPRPEEAGEHVDDPRHEALHDAELAVDADRLQQGRGRYKFRLRISSAWALDCERTCSTKPTL